MSGQNSDILAVGVGSAGSRIVALLSKQSVLVDRFLYVSCDDGDLGAARGEKILIESRVSQKLTPSTVRGLAEKSIERIRDAVKGAKVVFVVAGLGGATGSGLAPLIASVASESGATTVGVAVMPFEYERKLKFYAGVSLRRLRQASRGVIVVDNDNLMRSSPEDSTLTGIIASANAEAAKVLGGLLAASGESSIPVGLNKVLATVLGDGYSLLGMSSSGSPDKAEQALAGAVVSIAKLAEAKEASKAVVILTGDASLSASDIGTAVKRLGSMIDNESVDAEYGVRYEGSSQVQVGLLASGFRSTKYDDYDPLWRVLGGRCIDDEADSSCPEPLEALQPCD